MTELRVLGIGSPFAEDRVGWEVIKLLQKDSVLTNYPKEKLLISYHDRPGLRLIELMEKAKTVFLIDAVRSETTEGRLHCFKNKDLLNMKETCSSHSFDIAHAIEIAKALNVLPKQIVFYGIEIKDIKTNFKMSDRMCKAISLLSIKVRADIIKALI